MSFLFPIHHSIQENFSTTRENNLVTSQFLNPPTTERTQVGITPSTVCLSRQPLQYTVLGTCYCTLPTVPRLTQPSTLRGTVKWVSPFGLSNNNKRWRWMWMVAANYQQIRSPSWLTWSEGWRPSSAQSAFITWTTSTLTMALSHDMSTIHISSLLLLLLLQKEWILAAASWTSKIEILSSSLLLSTMNCPNNDKELVFINVTGWWILVS